MVPPSEDPPTDRWGPSPSPPGVRLPGPGGTCVGRGWSGSVRCRKGRLARRCRADGGPCGLSRMALIERASATLPRVDLPPDERSEPRALAQPSPDLPPDLDADETIALFTGTDDDEDGEAYDPPPPPAPPHRSRYWPGRPRRTDPRAWPPGGGPAPAGAAVLLAFAGHGRDSDLGRRHDVRRRVWRRRCFDPEVIWGLLALQGLFLAWRLLAVGSSLLEPALPRPGRRDLAPIALLLALRHRPAGLCRLRDRDRPRDGRRDLRRAGRRRRPRRRSARRARSRASCDPAASPTRAPPVGVAVGQPDRPRVTGLLVGVDAGVGRNTYLTDTMIVVSLDPVTRDRLDGVDPARHGRRPAGRRAEVPRQGQLRSCRTPGTTRGSSRARTAPGFDVLMDALGHAARTFRSTTTRRSTWVASSGRRHARRRRRERRARLLRPDLRRVRLHARLRDHGRPPPPQRPAGARLRARPQGRPARATSRAPPASRR